MNSSAQSSAPPPFSFVAVLREPLLHFVLLGGLLFAADQYFIEREGDPRVIVIDAAAQQEMQSVFQNARGKSPDSRELAAVREQWLNNEVLYREGLAMKLDKGDKSIQDRVIFKALTVVDAGVKLPPADDATLKAYFEQNRARYDEPARYDFEEAVLSASSTESEVRAFVAELNHGAPADEKASLRIFKARPLPTIDQSYGPIFSQALAAMPRDQWQALDSRGQWRAIRVSGITPPKPAIFAAIRDTLRQHWADATAAEMRTAAVKAMARKYRIKDAEPAP